MRQAGRQTDNKVRVRGALHHAPPTYLQLLVLKEQALVQEGRNVWSPALVISTHQHQVSLTTGQASKGWQSCAQLAGHASSGLPARRAGPWWACVHAAPEAIVLHHELVGMLLIDLAPALPAEPLPRLQLQSPRRSVGWPWQHCRMLPPVKDVSRPWLTAPLATSPSAHLLQLCQACVWCQAEEVVDDIEAGERHKLAPHRGWLQEQKEGRR